MNVMATSKKERVEASQSTSYMQKLSFLLEKKKLIINVLCNLTTKLKQQDASRLL